jgi:signal transduction histidine kinase
MHHLFEDSSIHFSVSIEDSLYVEAIPVYLESILNNFITNAVKYRKQNQESIIRVYAHVNANGLVGISVEDNGLGLNLELAKDKIFKINNRFHKHVEGKGIGLFYSKAQADAMGGTIEVKSEPNKGSTFTLWLPKSNHIE